jgi:hypothetical protein
MVPSLFSTLRSLGALALLQGVALAGKGAEVGVVGAHIRGQEEAEAAILSETMASAISSSGNLEAMPPQKFASTISGREALILSEAFQGSGRKRLEEGRVLYERADFEGAIEALSDATRLIEQGLPHADDARDLLDAQLLLGVAALSNGDDATAGAAFRRVVTLDPARELDAVNFPPAVVSRFNVERKAVLGQQRARVKVDLPEGAVLRVDGAESASRELELAPGRHVLVVSASEGMRATTVLELRAGESRAWKPSLDSLGMGAPDLPLDQRQGQTEGMYRSLGRNSDRLVLLSGDIGGGKVGVQLFEPRTGNFSKPLTDDAGQDPGDTIVDLLPALAGYVGEQGTLRSDRVTSQPIPLDMSTNPVLARMLLDPAPLVETRTVVQKVPWYVWASGGALIVGTAVVVGVVAAGGEGGPSEQPQGGTVVITFP